MKQLNFLNSLEEVDYTILDDIEIPSNWEKHTRERQVAYLEFKRDTKYKKGDIGEDGKVFWSYHIGTSTFCSWVTKEKYEKYQKSERERTKRREKKRRDVVSDLELDERLQKGDVREDGMVFVCYHGSYKNGERWATPEAYEEAQVYAKASWRKAAKKRSKDDFYIFSNSIRKYMRRSLQNLGARKNKSKDKIIGLSMPDLKDYLISKFQEGMEWDDRGKTWHIDHRLPLSAAKTEEEVEMLWHWSNLQPMWAKENIIKGSKYCPIELTAFFKERKAKK